MDIHTEHHGRTLVLTLPEEFSTRQTRCPLAPLARLLAAPHITALIIDMTDTTRLNTDGVAVLRTLANLAADRGIPANPIVPDPHLCSLLHALGLDQGLNFTPHWPTDPTATEPPPTSQPAP